MIFVPAKVEEIRMTQEHLNFFSDYMIFSLPLFHARKNCYHNNCLQFYHRRNLKLHQMRSGTPISDRSQKGLHRSEQDCFPDTFSTSEQRDCLQPKFICLDLLCFALLHSTSSSVGQRRLQKSLSS